MTLNDLSSEQQEFVHLALSEKNVLCDACIGSGKTSTINVLCDAYPPERRILYLTYNRLLKLDAKDKIKNHNVLVQNYHGFASLPLSFTKYTLTETKLIIQRGCFNLREDEIQLYRVRDIAFKQNFYERLCRVGSIHLCSTDAMTPEIDIRRIKNPRDVKEVLSKTIEACRKANGIRTSEIIGEHGRFPEPDPHGMPPEPCHEHPHN